MNAAESSLLGTVAHGATLRANMSNRRCESHLEAAKELLESWNGDTLLGSYPDELAKII